ncbi:efflux transporter outer membrane subunit [Desulfatiglans anilini]|uniref:efflux transporter outer membrane subunit n=1 Tax=Desulfatiglans anilini TaxID=90728 RepID=UPI00129470DA|nr:efflux transporter outer membrane subunit [Desulfatiglans anilini]
MPGLLHERECLSSAGSAERHRGAALGFRRVRGWKRFGSRRDRPDRTETRIEQGSMPQALYRMSKGSKVWTTRAAEVLAWFCCLFALAACQPFRPDPRAPESGLLPERYTLGEAVAALPGRWWESFEDPELNALVEGALAANPTLRQAWARLDQARAVAVQAGSSLYPDLTVSAGAGYSHAHGERSGALRTSGDDYSLGAMSRYEVDLWGKIRSEREAALLQVDATREDVHAAAMTLAAEVTRLWAAVIAQRMQRELLDEQLRINRIYLELVNLRFRMALGSALDVYQQQQIIDRVRAEIPLVEEQERLSLNQLAVLLGKAPGAAMEIGRKGLPAPSSVPATGLPADLLAARPDVRASMLRLEASDWQVAAARADRLPNLTLRADFTFGSDDLNRLFDQWLFSLAADLAAPILDGRRRAAEVDRTRAVVEEALARHREVVLTAVREVEDALVTEAALREHIGAVEKQLVTAERALREAQERYRKGLSDYLPVLTQILSTQELELNLIRRRSELLTARVNLYRALGGGWTTDLDPDEGLRTQGAGKVDRHES